jgi:isoleucyl-tRNA synthetase
MSKSLGNFVEMRTVTSQLGAEIIRLWCAATDYSGDLSVDDKILARVVDSYRRIRKSPAGQHLRLRPGVAAAPARC